MECDSMMNELMENLFLKPMRNGIKMNPETKKIMNELMMYGNMSEDEACDLMIYAYFSERG